MIANFEISSATTKTELSSIIAMCLALGGTMPKVVADIAMALADERTTVAPKPPAVVPEAPLSPVAGEPAVVAPPPPVTNGAPPAPSADVVLDSKGLPWDERIHAASKDRNGDQSWRKRRKVADADYEKVVAELRATYPLPGVTAAPASTAPSAPAATTAPEPPAAPPAPVAEAPPAPVVAAAPEAPAAPKKLSFPQLVAACDAANNGQGFTFEQLDEMAKSIGLDEFKSLLKQPEMIPYFEVLLV